MPGPYGRKLTPILSPFTTDGQHDGLRLCPQIPGNGGRGRTANRAVPDIGAEIGREGLMGEQAAPSTQMFCPVMNADLSQARKTTSAAMSSGRPRRG